MKPRKHLLATFSVLLVAALLASCVSPAVSPPATPAPPTATPIQPAATLEPTVSVVPTATVQAPPATPAAPGSEEQAPDVLSGFVENDGVRIHYEVEGEGPPLVLMHWLTGSLEDWRVLGYVDALKESYRLILIDARGHGQSDKPHDPAAYVLEKQAADIVDVLDELGVDKAHYFGYSLGGELGWALAKYAPDRLSSLSIGGASPEDFDPSAEIARDRGLGAEEYGNMAADVLSGYGFSRPEIYAIYAATDFEAIIADLQAISTPDFAADLPGMTMPALLLAGTGDEDYLAMEAATSKLPNATFTSLPGNDHMTAYLRTNLLVEHLTKFLAQEEKTGLDAATVAKIETQVSEMMARTKLPGFALGIMRDGELVYAKGFGVTNLDGGAPVTPQTVFQWAETSMAPTAMAVLQLVEQGKIDLDAPVTAYLPYFKLADERYKDITVGQILMHRSGIPDSGDAMADWENFTPQYEPSATERWVRSLADKGLLFAPGSGFEYSDLGYALLGDVIAKVRGQSYEETMSENILKPLGMNNSAFLLEEVDKALLAAPHVTNAAGEVVAGKALPYHRPFAAANNLFSSIEDMAKLAQASLNGGVLNGQRILPESAVEQMWTSHTPTSYGDFRFGTAQPARLMIDWGYGWFLGDVAGHRIPNTFGREYGIQSAMALAPDANLAVIAVGNGPVTGAYYASDTATDVMGMLQDIEPKKELTAKLDDATVATIKTLVREIMAKGKVPGAVVGVVKDGELVYASGFGVGKLGTDEPVTPDSVFPMGSVAKTPVAMAIMQLVAEGKIDLDAPVTKYLPYFTLADPDAGAITIRQLLSHTSGLPDTIDWLAEYQDKNKRIDEVALDDYVRSLSKESYSRPGKGWSYSSIGFDILGDVVAKVSGQNFEDYVQDHVLTPLGLEDSSYLLSDVNPTALVAPHMYDKQGNAKTLDFFPYSRTHAPSGAFYASVNDMARFAVANLNHGELNGTRVLPASAYDEMWAPQAASTWAEAFGPQVTNYGLGWWVGEFNGHRIIGNYGTEFGFQSHLGLFPDKGLAVIALVNLFDPEAGSFYAYDMGNGIAEALLGVEAKPTTQP